MSAIAHRLQEARDRALSENLPVRRKDEALYSLLSDCLSICEMAQLEGLEDELREAVRVSVDIRGESNHGRGRRFALKSTDVYVLVCRYVLENVDSRNNIYRYALVLREASKKQISSDRLVQWFKENGGMVELLKGTRRESFSRVSVLRLNRLVECRLNEPFTLTLKLMPNGNFRVIEEKSR